MVVKYATIYHTLCSSRVNYKLANFAEGQGQIPHERIYFYVICMGHLYSMTAQNMNRWAQYLKNNLFHANHLPVTHLFSP